MTIDLHNNDDLIDEVYDLADAVLSGDISADRAARLEQLVLEDASARRAYVRYMEDSLLLNTYDDQAVQPPPSVSEQAVVAHSPESDTTDARETEDQEQAPAEEAASESVLPVIVRPSVASRFQSTIDWNTHRIRFGTFSAVLTALAWIGFSYFLWSSTTPDGSRPERDGVNVNFVARITGQYEHQWAESARGIPWHAYLVPGERLNLVEGFIEITFYDGAKVVLEGPAEFVIDSRGAGTLEVGKLTADVTPEAVGFVVDTPGFTVTDLGTSFGIVVEEDGGTQLSVFIGRVEAEPKRDGQRQPGAKQMVVAGESIVVSPVGVVSTELLPDVNQFVRFLPGRPMPEHARRDSADQIALTPSSVIGGSGALASAWDVGHLGTLLLGENITDGNLGEADGDEYWLVEGENQYLVIDLGATYKIDQIDLYNTHNRGFNDFGTLNFRIEAANAIVDNGDPTGFDLSGTVTTILTGTLSDTSGEDPVTTVNSFSLVPTAGFRYLKFVGIDYRAGNDGVGLNEMEVFGEPVSDSDAATRNPNTEGEQVGLGELPQETLTENSEE